MTKIVIVLLKYGHFQDIINLKGQFTQKNVIWLSKDYILKNVMIKKKTYNITKNTNPFSEYFLLCSAGKSHTRFVAICNVNVINLINFQN